MRAGEGRANPVGCARIYKFKRFNIMKFEFIAKVKLVNQIAYATRYSRLKNQMFYSQSFDIYAIFNRNGFSIEIPSTRIFGTPKQGDLLVILPRQKMCPEECDMKMCEHADVPEFKGEKVCKDPFYEVVKKGTNRYNEILAGGKRK